GFGGHGPRQRHDAVVAVDGDLVVPDHWIDFVDQSERVDDFAVVVLLRRHDLERIDDVSAAGRPPREHAHQALVRETDHRALEGHHAVRDRQVDRTGAAHGNVAQRLGRALGGDAYRAVAQLGFPEQQRRQRVADLAVAAVLGGRNVQAIDDAAHAVDGGGEPQRALAGGDALDFAFEHDRARFVVPPDRMAVEVDARLVF